MLGLPEKLSFFVGMRECPTGRWRRRWKGLSYEEANDAQEMVCLKSGSYWRHLTHKRATPKLQRLWSYFQEVEEFLVKTCSYQSWGAYGRRSVAWTLARLFIPGWLEDSRCAPLRDLRGSSTGGRKQLVHRALLKSSSVSFYKISAEPHFCVKQDNFSAGSMGFELGLDAMCWGVERHGKWALPAEGFRFNNLVFSLQFLWAQSENFCQPGL